MSPFQRLASSGEIKALFLVMPIACAVGHSDDIPQSWSRRPPNGREVF